MVINLSTQTTQPTPLSPQTPHTGEDTLHGWSRESDYVLSGVIGRQLSEPLANMQKALEEIDATEHLSQKNMVILTSGVRLANKLTMQCQQIARLASGRLKQSHETLQLDVLLMAAMQDHFKKFRMRGIEIFKRIHPVEIIVDPSLLHSLLDTALDWACGLGRKLTVTLEIKNWPLHGLLILKTSHAVADSHVDEGADHPSEDTVGWYLLNAISVAMGLSINRLVTATETSLVIEFPRTVKRLAGLTAVEIETSVESMYGESRPMAGSRLLVITDDARLQAEIRSICRGTGLVVDCVSSAAQAVRFCELQTPHLVIIDQYMRNYVFDQLYEDLRNSIPSFPFIEIASAPNTLEMAGWTSDSISRLSRDALASHLAELIIMDLSKVM